jgi:hypothetical protein
MEKIGMEMLRYFWAAAVEFDERANALDEGVRFPLCKEGQLETLFHSAGLKQIEATSIVDPTEFKDFEDYWAPFLGIVGTAPGYNLSLEENHRTKIEGFFREKLPRDEDGSIPLSAKA